VAALRVNPEVPNQEFEVRVGSRSALVVERYDAELTGMGWEKVAPAEGKPGQRKWTSMGAKVGPTDFFDAAWKDPKSGRTAVLTLFHKAETPEVQHGTFDVYPKGEGPMAVP